MNHSAKEIFELAGCEVLGAFRTGSRVICSPPVVDTDEDWMILVGADDIKEFSHRLLSKDFELGGSTCSDERTPEPPDKFWSLKKDDLNLLITCNEDFFDDFHRATRLARVLNLRKKGDRILLFQAILYDCYNFDYDQSVEILAGGEAAE
jgi:hypothetical protein